MKKLIPILIMIMIVSLNARATGLLIQKLDHSLYKYAGFENGLIPQQVYEPLFTNEGQVLIEMYLEADISEVHDELEAIGMNINGAYRGLVDGSIDPNLLSVLAAQNFVSFISPLRPVKHMALEGEEVGSLRVPELRNNSTLNVDGSGVKVGMISNSFAWRSENERTVEITGDIDNQRFQFTSIPDIDGDGIPELTQTDSHLSGDLTQPVELLQELDPSNFVPTVSFDAFPSNFDEGRALAEIVNEIAPNAELAYYPAGSDAQLAQAIEALSDVGCNVIVDDVFTIGSPLFQHSMSGLAMKQAAEQNDVVFVTSLGNFGSQSIEAAFLDSNSDENDDPNSLLPEGNDLHNWNVSNSSNFPHTSFDITLPSQTSTDIWLYWEDPWTGTLGTGASTNYDLFVFSKSDSLVQEDLIAVSNNVQGNTGAPSGTPTEAVRVSNPGQEVVTYYVKVNLKFGEPKNFKLYFVHNPRSNINIQHDIWKRDTYMSIGHANSIYTLGVAAVHFFENDSLGRLIGNPRQINQTYYSSKGGAIDFLFSDTGEPSDIPERRFKPDISSIDSMNTSFYSSDSKFDDDDLPNFLGTSAAAPAAAGVIALMRSANPTLSAVEIRQLARMAATDIGSPGFDFFTGHGLLYADDAVRKAMNPPTVIEDWLFWTPPSE